MDWHTKSNWFRNREISSGRYFVEKNWGWEDWLVNNDKYCGKRLFFKSQKQCSWHYHNIKDETFYIASGQLLVFYSMYDCIIEESRPEDDFHFKRIYWESAVHEPQEHPDKLFSIPKPYTTILYPGDTFHVPVGLRHQMTGIEDTLMFEFSTQHLDEDSIRVLKGD